MLAGLSIAPVTALPDVAGAVSTGPAPSPELVALFEEFQAAYARYAVKNGAAEERRLFDRLCELADRISSTPAESLADVVVKLRLYRRWQMGRALHEAEDIEMWDMDAEDHLDQSALLAIARDIHRLAGRPDPWA
jgi:hypothetical protein